MFFIFDFRENSFTSAKGRKDGPGLRYGILIKDYIIPTFPGMLFRNGEIKEERTGILIVK
jgi:hypothetical protein